MQAKWRGVLALAAVLFTSGCTSREPPANVLILLIDALRADHLGCYGYSRDTSPHIDALAADSLRFENTFAQSPWTKPSIPTLFTSLYPIQHGVYEGEIRGRSGALESDVLAEDFTTLAEVFHEAGYRTAAFVHNAQLQASHGFSQGFDVYDQAKIDAVEINRRFLEFADRGGDRPFFAYLHYLDVHWPYQPDAPFRRRFALADYAGVFSRASWDGLRDRINSGALPLSDDDAAQLVSLYDAGIAELDHHIGELLEALRVRGLIDRTVVLLTSDHGEELLDHGKVGHGGTLFREVMGIPLIIRLPGRARTGTPREPARLLDVFPTLLRAAGIEARPGLEGRDLLASTGKAPEILAETRHRQTYHVSIRRGDWKYIRTYRAPRPAVHTKELGTFGLAPGMRIKAKGSFEADGALHASKVGVKDSHDDDLEISGPIEYVEVEKKAIGVLGFRLAADRLLTGDGVPLLPTLAVGEWVKVEGKVTTGRDVKADKLEKLAPEDRDSELEGIIQEIEVVSDEKVKLVIGNAPVSVTRHTRIKGSAPVEPEPETVPVGTEPFAADRLQSAAGLRVEEQLFDLAGDPREKTNVTSSQPELVAGLRGEMMAWLERMSRDARARAARQSLDQQSVEELRALGYLED